MRKKNTNTALLMLTILLCLVVIGLGAYTYSFYNEVKENESELRKDKELIQAELEEEIVHYSKLLEEKSSLSSQLSVAKERLEALQIRIDSNQISRSIVQQYQLELRQLRKEREFLFRQNDSLQQETRRLFNLNERTQNSLDSLTKTKEAIPLREMQENIPVTSQKITATNLQAYGVIQRTSGKFATTSRAARAQMIRICYTVQVASKIPTSELTFYVRVVNENNKVIGVERKVVLDTGERLAYNTGTSIIYKNEPYKICELVLPIRSFSKGLYKIEIYNSKGVLSIADLMLK